MRFVMLFSAGVALAVAFFAGVEAASPATAPTGVCDTSDALELIRLAHDSEDKKAVREILLSRLSTCDTLIKQQLQKHPLPNKPPTPMPWSDAPPPAPASKPTACTPKSGNDLTPKSDNDLRLYGDLVVCSAYWKNMSASPSSTPAPPTFLAAQPTFYVFATGTVDPTTNAMLIRSVVRRLVEELADKKPEKKAEVKATPPEVWTVLGRNDWSSISSYATQCQNDPSTRGAIVIEGDYPIAYTNNYLLLVNTGEQVQSNVELLGCDSLNNGTSVPPQTVFADTDLGGKSSTGGLPLGVWGGLAVLATNDNQTTTSAVTTPLPSPIPIKPVPKTVTTVTTTTSNVTPALAANALATSLGTITTPSSNAPWLLSNAAWQLSDYLFVALNQNCTQTSNIDLATMRKLSTPPSGSEVTVQIKQNLDHYRALFGFGAACNQFNDFAKVSDSTLNPLPAIQPPPSGELQNH